MRFLGAQRFFTTANSTLAATALLLGDNVKMSQPIIAAVQAIMCAFGAEIFATIADDLMA